MTGVDSLRLRADPVLVPLADGEEGELRFSLLSLAVLEEDFGSVRKAEAALRSATPRALRPADDQSDPLEEKAAGIVGRFLRAGFAAPGNIPSRDEALARVECELGDAAVLCTLALSRAFPPPDDSGKGQADGPPTSPSTGPGSTTPAPSAGVVQIASSGT